MYPKLSKQRGAVPTIIFSLLFFSTLFGSCAFIAKNVRGASVNVPFSKITGVETAFASAIQLRTGTVVSVLQQKNQQSVRRQRAKQLTADGIAALERGDESIAQTLFQQALESNPNDAIAHTYLGVLADRRGALSEAESHFAAAVRIDPNSPSAHNNFGAILVRLNRADRAAAEFEASLRLDANQSSALVNLAQIRFASNTTVSLRAARSLFERARAIAPDAEIARALVLISLQLDDKDVAAAKYRAYAVQFYGSTSTATSAATTPGARTQLGSALLAAGLGNEAIEELKAAVAFDSSNVEAIVLLARAYLARRDIPAAGRTLEGAVARGLDVAVIYAELADVYEAFGRPENSIPAMRLAIARDPKSEAYRFRYAMKPCRNFRAPRVCGSRSAWQSPLRTKRMKRRELLTMRGNSTRSLLPLLLIWALLMLTVGNMTKPLRFTNKRFRSTIRWPSCITLSPMRCSSKAQPMRRVRKNI